jgi:hypothetical protein
MAQSWESYDRSQEAAAIGEFFGEIEKVLQRKSVGRSRCFRLYNFGGKDADLDPHGCCGIKEIVGGDEETAVVRVGGHKTFCDPSEDLDGEEKKSVSSLAHETVCGGGMGEGEWTGDEWSFSFTEDVKVALPWSDEKTDEQNFEDIADAIIKAAREASGPIQDKWASTDEALEELYNECHPNG